MQANLSQIVKESLEANSEEFTQLVDDVACLLCGENGKVGNLEIIGRLVKLKPKGEALIIGDLHGDLESLIHILKENHLLRRMRRNSDLVLIFLGDYGDRGEYSKEVYYTVLKLKLNFSEQVILMRGNHEGPEDLMFSPHDLPMEFKKKFGEKWKSPYSKVRQFFACLYNALIVEERYLMIHGGIPSQAKTIEDLAYAHKKHPKKSFLEDMLWSDPKDMTEDLCGSQRGAGKLFGEKVTSEFLRRFDAKILIRGHEPCADGFKIDHRGKILTLFSRKGSPYFNGYGAYLNVGLSEKFESAQKLIPFIRRF